MADEIDAEKTFFQADLIMKKSFQHLNPQGIVQSLEEMMTAVIMMCQEWENGPDGKEHKVCPLLKLEKSKFTQFSYVTQELFNPDKMLKA